MKRSIKLTVLGRGCPEDPIELQYTLGGLRIIHLVALSFGPLWSILRRMELPFQGQATVEFVSKSGPLGGIGQELYLLAVSANALKDDFGVEEWLPCRSSETQPGPGRSSAQRTREVV